MRAGNEKTNIQQKLRLSGLTFKRMFAYKILCTYRHNNVCTVEYVQTYVYVPMRGVIKATAQAITTVESLCSRELGLMALCSSKTRYFLHNLQSQ